MFLESTNNEKDFFSVSQHDFSSGLLSTCGYAVYAQYVSVEFFNPNFNGLK